jgi:hypothetical protein
MISLIDTPRIRTTIQIKFPISKFKQKPPLFGFQMKAGIGLNLMMVCFRFIMTVFLLMAMTGGFCQSLFSYPKIIAHGKAVSDFVPKGWEILNSAVDYNYHTKHKGCALILEHADSAFIELNNDGRIEKVNRKPRILVVLFQDSNSGLFKLVEQNNHFILPMDPEYRSDPLASMTFANGILHISFDIIFGTSAHDELEYIFRYDGARFVLIGANSDYFNSATREYRISSFNFLTRKWWISQGGEGSEDTDKEIWHGIKFKGFRPLSAFQEPYTWEFNKGQSL